MDARLTLLAFPQRFDGARLNFVFFSSYRAVRGMERRSASAADRELSEPGDITPAFADADLQFEVHAINQPGSVSRDTPAFHRCRCRRERRRTDARPLFEELVANSPGGSRSIRDAPRLAEPRTTTFRSISTLPRTYRDRSFYWTAHKYARTDDSYRCAIKDRKGPTLPSRRHQTHVSWGQMYAYCLRHCRHSHSRIGPDSFPASVEVGAGFLPTEVYLMSDLRRAAPTRFRPPRTRSLVKRYAARVFRGFRRPRYGNCSRPWCFRSCSTIRVVPVRPWRRGTTTMPLR